ncbi:hypothetical protein B0H13DRAFT_2656569 [Mycena leptocephala]|nr:hypothetical protein B0H13DRAFT_2656569 [Mycena leptocephala]
MSFELPAELWAQIFQDLPRDAISNLSTVSTLFRAISFPLLFQALELTPYRIANQRVPKRLEFLSSDEIAPLVVKFSLHLRITGSRHARVVIELDSPDELLAATFKAITRFKNLRHLSCAFDDFLIVDISRLGFEFLPGLDSLTIRGGAMYCPRTPPPLRIRVKHFSYHHPSIHSFRQDDRIGSFLPALDPQSLCSVAVHFHRYATTEWIEGTSDLLHIFRNLHSLSVACVVFPLMQDQGSIALFPALRNLTITGRLTDRQNTLQSGTSLCPLLEHFTGSCTLLPRVLPGTSCTHLTLNPCTPDELSQALRRIEHMPSITTVTLRLSPRHLPAWSTAQAVWELFPGVVNLQLNMMLHGNSPESQVHTQESLLQIFTEIIGAPTALEQVTIRWNPEDEIMGMLHRLESRLRRAVPGLHGLYLDGGSRLQCPAIWDFDEVPRRQVRLQT